MIFREVSRLLLQKGFRIHAKTSSVDGHTYVILHGEYNVVVATTTAPLAPPNERHLNPNFEHMEGNLEHTTKRLKEVQTIMLLSTV